jgi:Acetyltransferase (GNAT) domain
MINAGNVRVLFGLEQLLPLSGEFNRIFGKIGAPATGRFPGLRIWMETYPESEPWGILIGPDGDYVAAALLTRSFSFGLWRIGKPGGNYDPVYFGALDDDAAKQLAQAICNTVQGFGWAWRIEIPDLPCPDSVVNQFLSSWPYSQASQTPPLACLLFKPGTEIKAYLSSNTRSAIAKANNRIKRDNLQMVQEWTRDQGRILALLPQILDIYRRRDHQLYGSCLIDNPTAESFFVKFVTEHANLGMIDLMTIHLTGKLAAFALCLFDNGVYWVLVNRVSPDWLTYSPGTIVNAEVVRHAFDDSNCIGVNWGGPLSRYKLSGEVTLVPRQTLSAWSSRTVRLAVKIRRCLANFSLKEASDIFLRRT